MGVFVTDETKAVTVGENTVHIRAGGFTVKESNRLAKLGDAISGGDLDALEPMMSMLIVSWEGPDFEGVPCDHEHIGKLDTQDPMFKELVSAMYGVIVPK